jgi:hypothetical protein
MAPQQKSPKRKFRGHRTNRTSIYKQRLKRERAPVNAEGKFCAIFFAPGRILYGRVGALRRPDSELPVAQHGVSPCDLACALSPVVDRRQVWADSFIPEGFGSATVPVAQHGVSPCDLVCAVSSVVDPRQVWADNFRPEAENGERDARAPPSAFCFTTGRHPATGIMPVYSSS